jgi:hypothetical protein
MGLKGPEDELEDFLTRQPSWVREILRGEYSSQATSAWLQPGGFELLGKAEDEYVELLKRYPAKLREYRKRMATIAKEGALSRLPSVPPGRPREKRLAREAEELAHTGLSQTKIAYELNRRHPDRRDNNGHLKPVTPEAVRKMLQRVREKAPDKT